MSEDHPSPSGADRKEPAVLGPSLAWAEAYAAFWQSLGPDSLDLIDRHMAETVRFADPFNDLTGRPAVRAYFTKVYAKLEGVTVTVHDVACGSEAAYLRWTFAYRMGSKGRPWSLEGMSEVAFDADGLAVRHIDHWDAGSQVYAKLPILGPIIRLIASRI